MALIYCPHCGKPISDKAEKCIHCGVTFNEENAYSNTQDSPPAVVDVQKTKVKSDNSGKFCLIASLLSDVLSAERISSSAT